MTTVGVVVVLYNPKESQLMQLNSILEQQTTSVELQLILVDNSTNVNSVADSSRLSYISNGGNRGIAYAQNVGIKRAKELGCRLICFFDQDSEYGVGYIERMVVEYDKIKAKNPSIATLGPLVVDKETNEVYKTKIDGGDSYSPVDTIISSGSLVEVSTFDVVGDMEEQLFIDLVDHEWCWRAQHFGYTCYQTTQVVLNHKVGNYNRTILGFPVIISAPARYYYKFRNFIWLFKRSYVPSNWKIKGLIRKIAELVCVPFIAGDISIWRYIFSGIKDGLTRR